MSNEGGGANFLTGFFIGAALGAMAALLLAPRSGKELRESLLEEGKKLRERAEEGLSDLKGRGEEAFQKTRETLRGTAEGVKDAARSLGRS
jgi:gas vesicle protein